MILRYILPKNIEKAVELSGDERIYYAVPVDIDEEGNWSDNSYLVVTTKKIYIFRYAYIARGLNILISGRYEEVESSEYEKICPKCGRVIPGTKQCPKCSKEGGFISVFLKMAKPYKKDFLGVFFIMVLVAVTTLLNPEIQKHLINDVLKEGGSLKSALIFLSIMFSLSVTIVILNIMKSNATARIGARISADLRVALFEKYQKLPLEFINDRRPGELLNRIIQDTTSIRGFMEDVFCNLFAILFIFIWDVIFMLMLNWKLALMTFSTVPILVVIILCMRKTIERIFHLQYRKNDDVASELQDVISGMRVVKTYGKEKEESKRFKHVSNGFALVQRRNERFWALFDFCMNILMGAGVVIVVYFGGGNVFKGEMSVGELYQFISYTLLLFQYIGWMDRIPREVSILTSCLERIYDVLAQDVPEEPEKVKDIDIKGEVTFDHATFGYKSYQPVLEDINACIKPGEMIGIVGASGTGKSTLINLLMGLYEIDDGRLLIDGNDLKEVSRKSYHSQIGVVLQETFLFSGTVIDNIRFSKPEATIDEIIRAAKLANAHDFISKLPDGYNTYVGEKGYTLSGGERQRIAIARAILPDPKLLILDEATASLDTESEFMIQKALERLTSGKTTFAIAHRLSTLKNADRIMVIDGHHIAEIGTHKELLARKGIYFNLFTAQIS